MSCFKRMILAHITCLQPKAPDPFKRCIPLHTTLHRKFPSKTQETQLPAHPQPTSQIPVSRFPATCNKTSPVRVWLVRFTSPLITRNAFGRLRCLCCTSRVMMRDALHDVGARERVWWAWCVRSWGGLLYSMLVLLSSILTSYFG